MPTSMELVTYKGGFSIDVATWMEFVGYIPTFSIHVV
jgi:hypothetical protein